MQQLPIWVTGLPPVGDQSAAFNIDGVAVAKAFVRRMADTHLDQVEVLTGPQALFYGKKSPGGVVAIRANCSEQSLGLFELTSSSLLVDRFE